MPFGLWKSKWEIHREDVARRDAEWTDWRAKSDEQWAEWREGREKAEAERAKADAEWRKRYAELMARIEENQRETMAAFQIAIDELRAVRREVHDLVDAVNANTEAVLKLIDRFDQWEGRSPGSGRMGPRSA